jgi:polyhydroxyalkanoate synthesis regulator phasin
MPQSRPAASSSRAGARSKKSKRSASKRKRPTAASDARSGGGTDSVGSVVELLVNRILMPFDLVVLSRERIQETLDEAAERGRVTRSDANELVAELYRLGRQQTEEILRWARRAEPLDQLVRYAERARHSVGVGSSLPISGYDELTASQVTKNLGELSPAELRRVRDYEQRHANRKSVLEAVAKALG